jgi:antitoxin component YwqK of YwqJK toxin-antitoxin module
MRFLSIPLLLFITVHTDAQCVQYKLTAKGDTINCVDKNGLKQGLWLVKVAPLRGEKGYEEEGRFINGQKEGTWRRFSQMGDPIAVENYRWGQKNGINRYYNISGLEREEAWKAMNPEKLYDTIDVQDVNNPSKFDRVVIKNEGNSLKHGTWRYYDPSNGRILLTENWILDQQKEFPAPTTGTPNSGVQAVNTKSVKSDTSSVKTKPKEVLEYEKKNAGKKKVKVRDGGTGG